MCNGYKVFAAIGVINLYGSSNINNKDSKIAYSSEGGHMNNIYWMEKTIDAALASPQKTTAAQ